MTKPWPWPDTKEQRHRRIIDSYRHALMEADPAGCRALDEQMAEFGQGWVAGGDLVGNDELKTAKELAVLLDLKPWNLHDWSRRHPDALPKHKRGGKTLFRVGDVQKYRATTSHTAKAKRKTREQPASVDTMDRRNDSGSTG